MDAQLQEFLTPKQLLFCTEYLTDMNATRAALRAGYSSSTALNGQLMHMPKIKCYLQQQTRQRAERVQVTHDQVLRELGKIAFSNMGDYFAADGSIKPMNEVNDDARAALWSVSIGDAGSGGTLNCTTKFRMYNKLAALDKIAKHIGFYNVEAKQPEPIPTYLNIEQLTADDSFDDAVLQEEIRLRKMQEAKTRKQAMARAKRKMELMERERLTGLVPVVPDSAAEMNDSEADTIANGGNVLFDATITDSILPQVAAANVADKTLVLQPEVPVRRGAIFTFLSANPATPNKTFTNRRL